MRFVAGVASRWLPSHHHGRRGEGGGQILRGVWFAAFRVRVAEAFHAMSALAISCVLVRHHMVRGGSSPRAACVGLVLAGAALTRYGYVWREPPRSQRASGSYRQSGELLCGQFARCQGQAWMPQLRHRGLFLREGMVRHVMGMRGGSS